MRRKIISSFLSICLMAATGLAQASAERQAKQIERKPAPIPEASAESSVDPRLKEAFVLHEIIGVYLSQEEYESVMPEFLKLLDLGLTGENEKLLVRGTWSIVRVLREKKQFELAHQIIDAALKRTTERDSSFNLLILKAKVFKESGESRKAVETYRTAQEFRE